MCRSADPEQVAVALLALLVNGALGAERSDHEVERVEADAGAGLGCDGGAPGHGLWVRWR
jgi:hypothetical protein